MMFLMNGKPWYDITKALYWLKKGAEEAGCASLSVRESLMVLPAGNRSPGHSCICQIKCINLQKNLLCP